MLINNAGLFDPVPLDNDDADWSAGWRAKSGHQSTGTRRPLPPGDRALARAWLWRAHRQHRQPGRLSRRRHRLQPEEVASIVRYLALEAPASMTGAVIDVNGASFVR
ncbi:MAG: hypothetical protein AAGD40_09080 [Pseudomonadota bacterium]